MRIAAPQRQMHSRCGKDNAQTLFGLERIPTTPQIRNILDAIAAQGLFRVFTTITYFHSAILPVIVAPGQSQVISLAPEFLTPQDGSEKQDCEVAAAKRWISNYASQFKSQPVTLLGDDLYSRQPMAEYCLEFGMNFIFTCLPANSAASAKDSFKIFSASLSICCLTVGSI